MQDKKRKFKQKYILFVRYMEDEDGVHQSIEKIPQKDEIGDFSGAIGKTGCTWVDQIVAGGYTIFLDDVGLLNSENVVVKYPDGTILAGNIVAGNEVLADGNVRLFEDGEDVNKAVEWLSNYKILSKEEVSEIDTSSTIKVLKISGRQNETI